MKNIKQKKDISIMMFSKLLLLILFFGFCKEKNIELPKEINVQKKI